MCVPEDTCKGIGMLVVSLLTEEPVFVLLLTPFVIVCKTAARLSPDLDLTRELTWQ